MTRQPIIGGVASALSGLVSWRTALRSGGGELGRSGEQLVCEPNPNLGVAEAAASERPRSLTW